MQQARTMVHAVSTSVTQAPALIPLNGEMHVHLPMAASG